MGQVENPTDTIAKELMPHQQQSHLALSKLRYGKQH
jgi:hypothetical protein